VYHKFVKVLDVTSELKSGVQ